MSGLRPSRRQYQTAIRAHAQGNRLGQPNIGGALLCDRRFQLRMRAMTAVGTFETCPLILRMSVHRGGPEVAMVRSNRRE